MTGRSITAGFLLMSLILLSPGFDWDGSSGRENNKGVEDFNRGDLDGAVGHFEKARKEKPDERLYGYNIGSTLYRKGDYDRAAEELGKIPAEAGESLSAKAYYNLGNTLYKKGDMEGALKAYEKSLMKNPSDMDAKRNYELIAQKLNNQSCPNPQNQGDKGEQNKKDERSEDNQQKGRQDEQQQNRQDRNRQERQDKKSRENRGDEGESEQGKEGELRDMTKEEALRLLRALQAEEAEELQSREQKIRKEDVRGKDW